MQLAPGLRRSSQVCSVRADVNAVPNVLQSSSGILETGVNTLQTTLVLKKRAEVEELHARLTDKRQEVQGCVKIQQRRRAELQRRQTEVKTTPHASHTNAGRSGASHTRPGDSSTARGVRRPHPAHPVQLHESLLMNCWVLDEGDVHDVQCCGSRTGVRRTELDRLV